MKAQLGKPTGLALALLATLLATFLAMGVFSVAQAQVMSPSATRTLSTTDGGTKRRSYGYHQHSVSDGCFGSVLIEDAGQRTSAFITATIQSRLPSINAFVQRTDGQPGECQ